MASSVHLFSLAVSRKVIVPQKSRARICTGRWRSSSVYQIQMLPRFFTTPAAAVGCTRTVLKVPSGVLTSSRPSTFMVTGQTKHLESYVPSCATDLLTGVFYASSQQIELGKNFVIPVFDSMRVIPVTMKVEGREVIKTPLGTFKTLRVQPTAEAGVVKNRGNIWIWYTDDERHLPVQMRAHSFWGTITFRLTGNEYK